ncbi:MAG: regulator of PEP synthase PpsR (kinase-PPPase family) [Gammaproteobacteria bacterium]|jgi:regulator of PEP synthase PpsR (kinase-PPPase family)
MNRRAVFFISDSTGITAETLGNALLSQFDDIEYEKLTLPFVSDRGLAEAAVRKINDASIKSGRVIVFSTFSNPELHDVICRSNALVMDLFSAFLPGLEAEFQVDSTHLTGKYHNLENQSNYDSRIDAIDFALQHDDGVSMSHYDRADLILIGVSRSGKTPTCIYLAMQFGLRAANYPITADDLERTGLPGILEPYLDRLYGLTINPQRLRQIRQIRRPDSRYSSLAQCRKEVGEVEALFRSRSIAYLDTSLASVEEIASRVIVDKGLQRRSL